MGAFDAVQLEPVEERKQTFQKPWKINYHSDEQKISIKRKKPDPKILRSFPLEIILRLTTNYGCEEAQKIIENTQLARYADLYMLNEHLSKINEYDLREIFEFLEYLCQKCGEELWKDDGSDDS